MLHILTQDRSKIISLMGFDRIDIYYGDCSKEYRLVIPRRYSKTDCDVIAFYKSEERAKKELRSIFEARKRKDEVYEITQDEEGVS